VKVLKEDLIKRIEANMETHESTYETAVEEFNKQQLKLLEELVEKARKGVPVDRLALSRMPVPENHIGDYNRALEMLKMETREKIELTDYEFNRYVLDEWEWTRNFTANTVAYAAAAGS
jgi:ATP phosphoribosyltransferase